MKKIEKIIMWAIVLLSLVLLVAAENGVFDNTNYNEYNIINATNVSMVGNLILESGQKICLDGATCGSYIYYNGTGVITVG